MVITIEPGLYVKNKYGIRIEDTVLVSPKIGQGILFFGCLLHRAQNFSNKTRISLDVRLCNSYAPRCEKPGYYEPLYRGLIHRCVRNFQGA